MAYNDYLLGMHPLWLLAWVILFVWIFILPYDIPGQRNKKDSPLDILQKRYAKGQITIEEYDEKRNVIEAIMARK
jgi:putative membrane protein